MKLRLLALGVLFSLSGSVLAMSFEMPSADIIKQRLIDGLKKDKTGMDGATFVESTKIHTMFGGERFYSSAIGFKFLFSSDIGI